MIRNCSIITLLTVWTVLLCLISSVRANAQETLSADKLFDTQAGERQGLAYDPGTDRLFTIERGTSLAAPQLRAYTLDGILAAGPFSLVGTTGSLTKLGLHVVRENVTIGGSVEAAGSLILLREITLYTLDKTSGNVLRSEEQDVSFNTGGLCMAPLSGGGKGLGYSTRSDVFLSTNSCCNCSGIAEFANGKVTGHVPMSIPGTSGGGDIKEQPGTGQLWIANAPDFDSVSILSDARVLVNEYDIVDSQTNMPIEVMRLAFDDTGEVLWLLGFDGAVYEVDIANATSVDESVTNESQLSLIGIRPNPSTSYFDVEFYLPTSASARLELITTSGRRVLSREVGSLGAGEHSVVMDGQKLASGVYVVRLSQSGMSVSKSVVLVR